MSSQPVCLCCRSPQATQRVAAIVAGGTQQVRVLTADLLPAAGVARTNLAQLLAPPRQPGGAAERLFAGVAGVGALVAIAITVAIAQLGERRRRAAGE
jgi:hypothetical protein